MKKLRCLTVFSLVFLFVAGSLFAESAPVIIKFGTIVPRGTSVSTGVEMLQDMFDYQPFQELMGQQIKYKVYWGAIQGDEPQMIQKAKMGQLDLITISPLGLALACKELEPFMIAYLITSYGEFDYVMTQLKKYINQAYYDRGWIPLNLATTEGEHHLYVNGPFRTPEEMKKGLIAGNYSGAADDTFYTPLGVPQTAVAVSDAFLMFKQGLLTGGIASAMMSISLQMYLNQKYVVLPCIRMIPNSFDFSRKRWEKLPWELKSYYIVMQPFSFWGAGIMRDSASAFYDSLKKVGIKEVMLTQAELKVIQDKVIAYRKTYIGDDRQKMELYNKIMKAKEEYAKGGTMEEAIFKSDPTYRNFKNRMITVSKAMDEYMTSGSMKGLEDLERKKVMRDWELYEWVAASEDYMKTGKPYKLKAWMKTFMVDPEVDELFNKNPDIVKKMFGSRKSVSAIIGSLKKYVDFPKYTGYQKGSGVKVQ
ncbi:MAG: TRAP transporter substrate-binding protein DctP [Spirochaetes bacterium]|jgi:TRAP-type C4-dicarboxylate transport system substrate-binding protein|nr:TRAP transporter substrate-binding protein DctP [Spirochaetota bacterium]